MEDFETIIAANYTQRESDDAELSAYQGLAANRVCANVARIVAEVTLPRTLTGLGIA